MAKCDAILTQSFDLGSMDQLSWIQLEFNTVYNEGQNAS